MPFLTSRKMRDRKGQKAKYHIRYCSLCRFCAVTCVRLRGWHGRQIKGRRPKTRRRLVCRCETDGSRIGPRRATEIPSSRNSAMDGRTTNKISTHRNIKAPKNPTSAKISIAKSPNLKLSNKQYVRKHRGMRDSYATQMTRGSGHVP